MIRRLCIVGVGLIGGSLARALRRAGYCGEVVGCGRRLDELERAVELHVIDRYELDPAAAVRDADIVVLAVPLGAMASVMGKVRAGLAADAVVTDVGSAKASVMADARRELGAAARRFVAGHPIAGTEHSGVEASFAELFERRRVVLTPAQDTDAAAIAKVKAMWEAAGAVVETLSAGEHDEVLAATSHLPHVLAYTLVETLLSLDDSEAIFRFAAGGFRDFTRIASSDPGMWHDICLANRESLLRVLDEYLRHLAGLRAAIAEHDSASLKAVFGRAKAARDRYAKTLGAR
jgi:prephenate dehydrogenase